MRATHCSLLALAVSSATAALADEGMWPIDQLATLCEASMSRAGCQLTATDLYDGSGAALSDAVCIFGDGCTCSLVSEQGLVITNHHCGYDAIQSLSSLTHNYLQEGYYARSLAEELPVPGLEVRALLDVTNVTDQILAGMARAKEKKREETVDKRVEEMETQGTVGDVETRVVECFEGAQYMRVRYTVYRDVRLVGTPPESVGKFGHDTDNWMWPRHTCDFSLFRVYAAPDNTPAGHNAANVPFHPRRHLQVNASGPAEGHYAMTIGFPGGTERYLSSGGIKQLRDIENDIRIAVRGAKLRLLGEAMAADSATYIAYASKYARSSNYHKYSQGMNDCLARLDVVARKEREEASYEHRRHSPLPALREAYEKKEPYERWLTLWEECLLKGPELLKAAVDIDAAHALTLEDSDKRASVKATVRDFLRGYDARLDQRVLTALARQYIQLGLTGHGHDDQLRATLLPEQWRQGDPARAIDSLFRHTLLTDSARLFPVVEACRWDSLHNDPAIQLSLELSNIYLALTEQADAPERDIRRGERDYLALRRVPTMYPDANFTKRLSYGHVSGYAQQPWHTTADGVLRKEKPGDPEFSLPPALHDLLTRRDYGPWADTDGTLHTCFVTTNDITGGNSGSPVLDAAGRVVGLAFDGNWEAMSGDIIYEPLLQRCICVDIRYVLFAIDRLGHCQRLIDELLPRER